MKNKKALAIGIALLSAFAIGGYSLGNNKDEEFLYYHLLNDIEITKTYDRNELFKESFVNFTKSEEFKNIDLTVETSEIFKIFDSLRDDFLNFTYALKVDEDLWETDFVVNKYSKEEIESLLNKIDSSKQDKDRFYENIKLKLTKLKEETASNEADKIISSIEKILLSCNDLYSKIENIALEHKSNLDNNVVSKEDISARIAYVEIMKEFDSLSSYVHSIKIPKSTQNFSIDDLNMAKIEVSKVSLVERISAEIELTEKEELLAVVMRSEMIMKTFEDLTKDLSKEFVEYYKTEDSSALEKIKAKINEELDIIKQYYNTLKYESSKELLGSLENYVFNQLSSLEETLKELPKRKIDNISNKKYCETIINNYKKVEEKLKIFDETLKNIPVKTI